MTCLIKCIDNFSVYDAHCTIRTFSNEQRVSSIENLNLARAFKRLDPLKMDDSFYLQLLWKSFLRTYLRASLKARTLQELGKLRVRNSITVLSPTLPPSLPRTLQLCSPIEKDSSGRWDSESAEFSLSLSLGLSLKGREQLKMSATLRTATEKTILLYT